VHYGTFHKCFYLLHLYVLGLKNLLKISYGIKKMKIGIKGKKFNIFTASMMMAKPGCEGPLR
jgi:hypothetical protein